MFSRLFDREMDRQTDGLLATAQSALCIQRRVVKIQVACSCRPKLMKYRQCWSTHDVITCRRDLRPKSPNASSEKVVEQYSPKKQCHGSLITCVTHQLFNGSRALRAKILNSVLGYIIMRRKIIIYLALLIDKPAYQCKVDVCVGVISLQV